METYVILLRGVMPTGRNKLLMAPLRAALEAAGLSAVRTYIQSGNVVADSALAQAELERLVHAVIAREFGGDIAVLARTAQQFRTLITRNPFPDAQPRQLHVTLLARAPEPARAAALLATDYAPDRVALVDDAVYILPAAGYGAVKTNNAFIERRLTLAATTRIFATVERLVALSGGAG